MKPPWDPDAIDIGAHLSGPGSSLHTLFARAGQLAAIQAALAEWAGEPLASSLNIANERDGILVIYATSAAALTQVRFKQQELIHFLRQRLALSITKLEAKINPTALGG
jgi:hypothetical protein